MLQLSSLHWFSILIYSLIIGFGSNSYKQSIYFGIAVGLIPWGIQFAIRYNDGVKLLDRISLMIINITSPLLLIILSLIFITLLSIMISISAYYIKNLFYVKR